MHQSSVSDYLPSLQQMKTSVIMWYEHIPQSATLVIIIMRYFTLYICGWRLVRNYNIVIVVIFPQDILENGLHAKNFAMLGLGDIVIPGIFIAILLRYDYR